MFSALTERLRLDLQAIKAVVNLHDHARGLFYSAPGAAGDAREADPWHALREGSPRRPAWQIYDHCAALTRLYAVYSIFVDDLVGEYLQLLPQLYDYEQLPPPVLRQHRVGFGQILLKLGDAGPYRHLREGDILQQVSSGFAGVKPYSLLRDAFFVDRQNYRLDFLVRLFSYLGIENIGSRIAGHPAMKRLLEERRGGSVSVDGELARFVQLRNEAAHSQVEEVIGAEDFRFITDFIGKLCEILAELVAREVLQRRKVKGELQVVGTVEQTYHKGFIVIARMNAFPMAVDDHIIILRNNRIIRFATVRSIQVEDVDQNSVEAFDGQMLGIGLDVPCRPGVLLARLRADMKVSRDQQQMLFARDQLEEVALEAEEPEILPEPQEPGDELDANGEIPEA
ncbi:MAG: hypothetical protein KIT09_29365 [Bryobacteraceae bacterium]|nr:hypothetical protein [Bryobacteraceae bacterium]